jgi:hypothetical protein
VYCPYSSGPRNLPIRIEAIAMIRVAKAVPEIRKKPRRAESSATLTSSSVIGSFTLYFYVDVLILVRCSLTTATVAKIVVNANKLRTIGVKRIPRGV